MFMGTKFAQSCLRIVGLGDGLDLGPHLRRGHVIELQLQRLAEELSLRLLGLGHAHVGHGLDHALGPDIGIAWPWSSWAS